MFGPPSVTVYNPGDSATGSIRNVTDGTSLAAGLGTATDHAVVIGTSAGTADREYQYHMTAAAEIP
jgi:hypothetical protein